MQSYQAAEQHLFRAPGASGPDALEHIGKAITSVHEAWKRAHRRWLQVAGPEPSAEAPTPDFNGLRMLLLDASPHLAEEFALACVTRWEAAWH